MNLYKDIHCSTEEKIKKKEITLDGAGAMPQQANPAMSRASIPNRHQFESQMLRIQSAFCLWPWQWRMAQVIGPLHPGGGLNT